MMLMRTTVQADQADLTTLRQEARRRGMSLAELVAGVLADRAAAVRAQRRPRFGLFRSGGGKPVSRLSVDDESSPARTPPAT